MEKKRKNNAWNTFWNVYWREDNFKGWLISIIFLFILIKGLFFPILTITTGTELPLVIVESCSMYHEGNMLSDQGEWWQDHKQKYSKFSIAETDFNDFIFKKGFNKGDILFITKAKPEKVEVGDVIIFNANYRNPIIHRVMKITETEQGRIFSTIGDNNNGQINLEKSISEDQLMGKASLKLVPYFGWIKLVFFEKIRSPSERGFCHTN